jgi:hypothetical protein
MSIEISQVWTKEDQNNVKTRNACIAAGVNLAERVGALSTARKIG